MKTSIHEFELLFSKSYSTLHAFSFWKARIAMYAILKAIGIGPGDEVILPGYTCVMDVNPIKYLGAKPIYLDIEPKTYNMDLRLLEEKITENTKVIIAQHTYGYPCQMDVLMAIAQKHHLPVVEDCCLALGSQYKGKTVGSFGQAAYFSFQWNKPFTTGLGGMATTNDNALANKIETICRQDLSFPSFKSTSMLSLQRLIYRLFIYPRTTALAANLFRWLSRKRWVIGSSGSSEYAPEMDDDFFMAMGSAQARAGLRQLKKIDANIAHRKNMQQLYNELLSQAGFDIPAIPQDMDPVLVRYPLRVSDKQKALAQAPSHGVEIGNWFECPLHPIETPMHLYDYQTGMCPIAEKASREVINLPLHPRAGKKTVRRTVDFIKKTCRPCPPE